MTTGIILLAILALVCWCCLGMDFFGKYEKGIQRRINDDETYDFSHVKLAWWRKPKHLLFVFLSGPLIWFCGIVYGISELVKYCRVQRTGRERLISRFMRWLLEDHDSDLRKL